MTPKADVRSDIDYKSEWVRQNFRIVIQHATWVAFATCSGHAAIMLVAGYPCSAMASIISVLSHVISVPMVLRSRPFPVFLSGLCLLAATALMVLTFQTYIFGGAAGFQLLLIPLIPLTMFSGRISGKVKWCFCLGITAIIIWLATWPGPSSHLFPGRFFNFLYNFNIVSSLLIVAILTRSYFKVVGRAQAALALCAFQDPLTGLLNRRRLTDIAQSQIDLARKEQHTIAVALGDIDHFKSVNDRFGHDVGDEVLIHVSLTIQRTMRRQDIVARWGGEEFLLLMPNTDLERAVTTVDRIRAEIASSTIRVKQHSITPTITFGLTLLHPGDELGATIGIADKALYAGKAAGRNRVVSSAT